MKLSGVIYSGLWLALSTQVYSRDQFDESSYEECDVIRRDIAIVGGGAAGTYAAISLKDKGKSFALVELTNRLGGHAHTYTDPATGGNIDYGVQLYLNNSIVRNFFKRLNSPLADVSFASFGQPIYSDYSAKKLVKNYPDAQIGEDYINELKKYPYLENGLHLPKPVPKDLLLTWPEYIKKHNLSRSSAYATFSRPASPGDLLKDRALYVFNDVNNVMLREDTGRAVHNGNNDNSEIYRKAMAELKNHILLKSHVVAARRSKKNKKGGIRLVVRTPAGHKLIVANQLVMGIPPVTYNMKYFGLDSREQGVLSQIYGSLYYGGVVNNTGLSDQNSYPNRGIDTEYNVAKLPSVVMFNPSSTPGYHYYWYNTLERKSRAEIEHTARNNIKMLQKLTNTKTKPEPNFVAFSDFSPFHLVVNKNSINRGFYNDMYALQGYRGTWYIGTLFIPGSSQVWKNTAAMLPHITAAAKQKIY